MRYALGLDVAPAASFAAVIALDAHGARPRELPISPALVPSQDASIVDATLAAIALATRRNGQPPAAVSLVHPLAWDARRVQRLRRSLAEAGAPDVVLHDAATAAAVASDAEHPIAAGDRIVVVALRPGGAEVLALRKGDDQLFRSVGPLRSVDGVEESRLDDVLLHLVGAQIPGGLPIGSDGLDPDADAELRAALTRVRAAVRVARERLTTAESTVIGVHLPGVAMLVSVERSVFQDAAADLIRPVVPPLLAAVTAAGAGHAPVLLVGTALPAPLLAELLAEGCDAPVLVSDARHGGAFGAASLAAGAAPVMAPAGAEPESEPASAPQPGAPEPIVVEAVARGPVTPEPEPETVLEHEPEPEPEPAGTAAAPRSTEAQRPHRRPVLAVLLPVAAAAAALIVLGGAAATGVLGTSSTGGPVQEAQHPASTPSGSDPRNAGPSGASGQAAVSTDDASRPGSSHKKTTTAPSRGDPPTSAGPQPVPTPTQTTQPPVATDPPTGPPSDPPSDPPTDPPTDPPSDPPVVTDPPTDPPVDPPVPDPGATP